MAKDSAVKMGVWSERLMDWDRMGRERFEEWKMAIPAPDLANLLEASVKTMSLLLGKEGI